MTSPSLIIRLLLGPPLILYAIRSDFLRPGAGSPRIVKMSTRNRSVLGCHGGDLSGGGSLHWMMPGTQRKHDAEHGCRQSLAEMWEKLTLYISLSPRNAKVRLLDVYVATEEAVVCARAGAA